MTTGGVTLAVLTAAAVASGFQRCGAGCVGRCDTGMGGNVLGPRAAWLRVGGGGGDGLVVIGEVAVCVTEDAV